MPSLKNSRVALSPDRWQAARPAPAAPTSRLAPILPPNLKRSATMLSSLPSIATNISTGGINQFYGGRTVPRRQVILSS